MFFLESKRTKKRGGCDSPAPRNRPSRGSSLSGVVFFCCRVFVFANLVLIASFIINYLLKQTAVFEGDEAD